MAAIAHLLGIGRFAVFGHSGGGPHALVCAALLPGRVVAWVSVCGPAPFDAEGLDWFAGRTPGMTTKYRAAADGRVALEAYWAHAEPQDMSPFFTKPDLAALDGSWSYGWAAWLARLWSRSEGLLEDTLAFVTSLSRAGDDTAVLVAGILRLARDIHLRTVAEGVGERAQSLLLAEVGCDSFQGFLISRPLTAPAAREYITRTPWSPIPA